MTAADREKLRQYRQILEAHRQEFTRATRRPEPFNTQLEAGPVHKLSEDINRIFGDYPDLLPAFKMEDFLIFKSLKGRPFYENASIRSYLARAITRIDETLSSAP